MNTIIHSDSDFKSFIIKNVHPFLLKNVLFFTKIEYCSGAISYIQSCIQYLYHIDILIHINFSNKIVTYTIKNTSIKCTISY